MFKCYLIYEDVFDLIDASDFSKYDLMPQIQQMFIYQFFRIYQILWNYIVCNNKIIFKHNYTFRI